MRPLLPYRFRYELVHGERILATGQLTETRMLQVGERFVTGGTVGVVRAVQATANRYEFRLLVQI